MSDTIANANNKRNSNRQFIFCYREQQNQQMTDDPVRVARLGALRKLVDAAGGIANFAREHEGIDPTYVSQLLNGHRGFGERAARNMEGRLALPRNYLDREGDDLPAADQAFLGEVTAGLQARDLPEHIRQTILTLIASSPEKK